MKVNLFESAVSACKRASDSELALSAKFLELEELTLTTASHITVACNESYQWYLSVNRKHGAKTELSRESGVSQKSIGRYIAAGHIELVTNGKIEAGVACNAINNYRMKLSEVESVKTLTEWYALVKACKLVLKNGAGNNGNGGDNTDTPDTDTPDTDTNTDTPDTDTDTDTPFWVLCADKIAEEISSGEISLMEVIDYISEIVAERKALSVV